LEIENEIVERGWPLGEVIGSEGELIDRYGASRAVFREAVRIVEHHGVARMRRGPNGGLVVTAPDLGAIERAARLYLNYEPVTADDLFTLRDTLECTAVRSLADTIDEEGVARLRRVLDLEQGPVQEAVEEGRSHDLHIVIAELTGNVALRLFVEILARLTHERTRRRSYHFTEMTAAHKAHLAIFDAVIDGDGDLAEHRMRSHLGAVASYFDETEGPAALTMESALPRKGPPGRR
jgi:DNA-binding FadR family transcriptional regulator